MQQASDLFYTMAVWVLKQTSTSKTLSSLKLTYPNLEKGKSHRGGYFFSFKTFALCFFWQNSPRLSARDLHFVGKASQEGFAPADTVLGSAYAESLDMGRVGRGLLLLTLLHNDALNTKHGYKICGPNCTLWDFSRSGCEEACWLKQKKWVWLEGMTSPRTSDLEVLV